MALLVTLQLAISAFIALFAWTARYGFLADITIQSADKKKENMISIIVHFPYSSVYLPAQMLGQKCVVIIDMQFGALASPFWSLRYRNRYQIVSVE